MRFEAAGNVADLCVALPAIGFRFRVTSLEATQEQVDGSVVNSYTNANRIEWHLWEIDLRFAPGLPPGWRVLGAGPLGRVKTYVSS